MKNLISQTICNEVIFYRECLNGTKLSNLIFLSMFKILKF